MRSQEICRGFAIKVAAEDRDRLEGLERQRVIEEEREREREGQGGSVCVRVKVQVRVRMGRAVRVAKDKTHGCNVRSSHPQGTGERKKEIKKIKNKESSMAKMCCWMDVKMKIWP